MSKKATSICLPFQIGSSVNWEIKRFFNPQRLSDFLHANKKEGWTVCDKFNCYPTTPGIYYLSRGKFIKIKS